MEKISFKIQGMVCNGCENRVKNALKSIDGVKKVDANHKSGMVTVSLKEEIEESVLKNIIENLGYEIVKED